MEREEVKRAQLMMLFRGTRKGDETSVEAYVNQLKSISDSLAAIGSPVSEPDMVLQLLAGITNPKYMLLQNTITSRCPLPNFSEACSMLHEYEKMATRQLTSISESQAAIGSSSSGRDSPQYLPLQNTISAPSPLSNFSEGNDGAMNSLILHGGNNRAMNTPSNALQIIDPQVTTQSGLQPETIVKIVGAIAASPVIALIAKECWKKFESYLDNKLQGDDTNVTAQNKQPNVTMEMYHETSCVSFSRGEFQEKHDRTYWSGTSSDLGRQLGGN